MPSYNSFTLLLYKHSDEIAKFRIETKPLAFRGTRWLSWILHHIPHIVEGTPKFHFRVTRLSQRSDDPFGIQLSRQSYGITSVILERYDIKQESFERDFEDESIGAGGWFVYNLRVLLPQSSAQGRIVSFRALDKEEITLVIGGAAIGAAITLLLTRLLN